MILLCFSVTIIQDCKTTVLIYNTDDQSFKEIATGDIIKGIASGIDTLNNEYILFYTRQKKLRLIYFWYKLLSYPGR